MASWPQWLVPVVWSITWAALSSDRLPFMKWIRRHPAVSAVSLSLGVLAGLLALLHCQTTRSEAQLSEPPLFMYCAAALRVPAEQIAHEYEREYRQRVELTFGGSQSLLSSIEVAGKGDLFLSADETYIHTARQKKLAEESMPLARMTAVVLVHGGFSDTIHSWRDLLADSVRLAQANPEAAAIGKLTRDRLLQTGHWDELAKRTRVFKGTVSDVANAVQLGAVDAGIVWDAVTPQYPGHRVVHLPELEGIVAQVQIAVLTSSGNPMAALRFAHYAAHDKARAIFQAHGFSTVK